MTNRLQPVVYGDDRDLIVTILQEDGVTVEDVSGYTAFSVKLWNEDGSITKGLGSGVSLTSDGTNGKITVTVSSSDWLASGITNGDTVLSIELQTTDSTGKINTPVQGVKSQVKRQELT